MRTMLVNTLDDVVAALNKNTVLTLRRTAKLNKKIDSLTLALVAYGVLSQLQIKALKVQLDMLQKQLKDSEKDNQEEEWMK